MIFSMSGDIESPQSAMRPARTSWCTHGSCMNRKSATPATCSTAPSVPMSHAWAVLKTTLRRRGTLTTVVPLSRSRAALSLPRGTSSYVCSTSPAFQGFCITTFV